MPQYVFTNLEHNDPKMPFDFTFQGKLYSLRPNAVVDLPNDVADHLNRLAIPVYADVPDGETGELVSRAITTRKRFSLTPVADTQAKPARAKDLN